MYIQTFGRRIGVYLVASFLLIGPTVSNAAITYSETEGILTPTNTLDFSIPVLTEGETVTTQFAGVTFSGTNGSPRFQTCGPSSTVPSWGDINLDDSTWIATAGLPCGNNAGIHDMTIMFDDPVNAASFQFLAYLPRSANMVIDVSLAGTVVASFTITGTTDGATNPVDCSHLDSATFTCGFLQITDLTFDTIFVAQPLPDTSYLTLDNLWWGSAQDCVHPPSGLVSWWPGDGDATDGEGGNDGTLQGGATFAPGKVGQGFSFSGVAGERVQISHAINLNIESLPGSTFEGWFRAAA